MDWSSQLTFKEFATFCQRTASIDQEQRNKKRSKLDMFLHSCLDKMGDSESDTLYPVMRLLLPGVDKARGSYRIKESVMANLYIDMLQLGRI